MNAICKLETPKLYSCDYMHTKKKQRAYTRFVASILGADKESVNSGYISIYHPFMTVSIIEHSAVDNRYVSIIGRF